MKKLLVLALLLISVFLIYLVTIDKKVYYLSLGDFLAVGKTSDKSNNGYTKEIIDYLTKKKMLEEFHNEFASEEYRSIDLYNDIVQNKKVLVGDKEISIKNALIKADILTLSIGTNDLFSKLNYPFTKYEMKRNIDEIIDDIENLLKLIREYCKEDIIILNYANLKNDQKIDEYLVYANNRLKKLCETYDITCVDIYTLFKNNQFVLKDNIYPKSIAYREIGAEIVKVIEGELFEKN